MRAHNARLMRISTRYYCHVNTSWWFRTVLVIVGIGCITASVYVFRFAKAERLAYKEGDLDAALALAPNDARFWEQRAYQYPIQSYQRRIALGKAIASDQHNARLWMELGTSEAFTGDIERAEQSFIKASKFNRGYEPHWLLANLYFRRGRTAQFWMEVRSALASNRRGVFPLFELCWSVTQDGAVILQNLPKRRPLLTEYLAFLLHANRNEALGPVADLLLGPSSSLTTEESETLLLYCERLIVMKEHGRARRVWDQLVKKGGLMPKAEGMLLVNGELRRKLSGRGFDWRFEAPNSVGKNQDITSGQLEFRFTGSQEDTVTLLRQYVTLKNAEKFAFRYDYRMVGIAPASGIRWVVLDDCDGSVITSSPILSSSSWLTDELTFRASEKCAGQQLVLSYVRQRGTLPTTGTFVIRRLALSRVD